MTRTARWPRLFFAAGIALAVLPDCSPSVGGGPSGDGTGNGSGNGMGGGNQNGTGQQGNGGDQSGGGQGNGSGSGAPLPGESGAVSAGPNNNLSCQTELSTSGTFTQNTPPPFERGGGGGLSRPDCWPDGVWTFSATVTKDDASCMPNLMSQYQFQVTVDQNRTTGDQYTYSYLNDPSYMFVRMKVSGGGGGQCDGDLEVFSTDGKSVLNMHVALQPDNSLNGLGTYSQYTVSQWD